MSSPYYGTPLSPLRAQFFNALVTKALPCFALEKASCSLDVNVTLDKENSFDPLCALHIQMGKILWRVEFASLAPLLLQKDIAESGGEALFADLPQDLILAVMESLFAPVLAQLSLWLQQKTAFVTLPEANKLDSDNAPSSEQNWAGYFDLMITLPEKFSSRAVPLRLFYSDDEALRILVKSLHNLPSKRSNVDILPVPCALEIGRMRLSLPESRNLELGDVLLPTSWDQKSLFLRLPDNTGFACRKEENQGVVIGFISMEESMADDSKPAEQQESQKTQMAAVDDLEMDVRFELGHLSLSVGELATLAPGFTFALPCDPTAPVTLRANAKAFAQGRLVDLNGTVGVQITRLFQQNHTE